MSTTTNIGLFKHDKPATNTDEFNVDKALNQNWDKLDTAIGTDRERITTLETDNTTNKQDITDIKAKDTEQDKYISELEAENTRLRQDLNGLPKGQVSGETLDISDSAEMRCGLKISGNSKQETREGYNIAKINTDNFELTSNTIKNKSTTVGGNILTHIKLKAGQTITSNLLLLSKPSKDTSFSVRIGSSDVANLSFSKFDELNLNTKQSKIYTATEDVEFDVKIWGNANKDIFEFQYWVTIGTEEKDYEQYGASPSPDYPSEVECCGDNGCINEVICNKNLLPNIYSSTSNNGVNYEVKEDGTIIGNGTATATASIILVNNNLVLPKGIYTLSGVKNGGDTTYKIDINYETKYYADIGDGVTFILDKETTITRIRVLATKGQTFTNELFKPMLVKGNKKVEYEQHKEQTYTIPTQQPFRSVGNTRDTFIKKNNKWYERHNINRRIFDGTINKFLRNSGTTNNLFVTNTFDDGNIIVPKTYGENVQHFNNYFQIKYSSDEMYIDGKYIGSAIRPTDDIAMGFGKESEINTVDKANAWLKTKYDAGAPLYVDYPLETPLDIECTEEQNTILDKIEKEAKTYKNVTHIYSTDEISPVIDVTYKKDIDTMITNIEQAILSQGGNI